MSQEQTTYRIMGIDPGTNYMGYGIIDVVDGKPQAVVMGEIDMHKISDAHQKLRYIFERVRSLTQSYQPTEVAFESPFFGTNVQSMLKLGRAQGVAIAAAISRQIPIQEYAPMKIKMSITGNGQASKEQVAAMIKRMLNIKEDPVGFLDATDALGAAYCHFLQMGKPETEHKYRSWADFANKNKEKISFCSASPCGKKQEENKKERD